MVSRKALFVCLTACLLAWTGTAGNQLPEISSLRSGDRAQSSVQESQDSAKTHPAVTPRGKKLILKDGSYQLAKDYQRNGDRVRYLSAERGEWEELPASLVDWEATAKAEAAEKSQEDALARKAAAREKAEKIEKVMDVDASLQVAPGLFLPPGEGMFLIEGKHVTPLEQAGSEVKTDKKQFLKQVLSPIPIIPSQINIQIPGARAKVRMNSGLAEFYLREAPPDPDRTTPIVRSSRPGESGPEVELVHATVKGNKRQLESIRSLFGQQIEEKKSAISIQRWEVAPTVFRFTLSQKLTPGEYALAEILPDGMNLYVWDFGVDPVSGTESPKAASKK
jgi:hypothetical protein